MAIIQAVRKITARDVIGKIEKVKARAPVLNDDGTELKDAKGDTVTREVLVAEARDLYIVYGRCTGHRIGKSQYGDSYVFEGDFEARRLADGQVFQSRECIFPPIAQDMAINAYVRAKAEDESAAVQFAFVVGCVPDARGTEGFKFTVKYAQNGVDPSDPLVALRSSLAMDFAEVLGETTMQRLGFDLGNSATMIEGPAEVKGKAKEKSDA